MAEGGSGSLRAGKRKSAVMGREGRVGGAEGTKI